MCDDSIIRARIRHPLWHYRQEHLDVGAIVTLQHVREQTGPGVYSRVGQHPHR